MALTLGGLDVGAALGMMLMPTYLVTSGGDPFSSITRSATESGDAEDEGSTASSSLRSAGRIWQAHYYVFAIAGVMLSAAAKSRRQEGALGGVAATIAGRREQAIAAQTSEISWSYLAEANCIFD